MVLVLVVDLDSDAPLLTMTVATEILPALQCHRGSRPLFPAGRSACSCLVESVGESVKRVSFDNCRQQN